MPKLSGTKFMLNFIKEYLSGEMDRLSFDLDFNYYLIKHYPSMERANPHLADCFSFYLGDEGFDKALDLDDSAHKALIRRQWKAFNEALEDGLF